MDLSPRTKRILALVAFIVFIDMLGIGLILPVMPRLIGDVSDVGVSRAAEIGGYLMLAYAAMQFLFAPIVGGLSDRFGRRPVLLIMLLILSIDYAIMAIAPTLAWLFIGRLLSGIMGASWTAANSCVADCIPRDHRGAAFGALGGAGAAGFVLGPAIGGLAGEFDTRLPFVIAALLALTGAVLGYFVLKETLPKEKRRRFDLSRANPLGSIRQLSATPLVIGCLIAAFFMQLSSQAQLSIWAYWGELQFGWTPLMNGLTVALYGIMLALTQGVLTGWSIARFGAVRTAKWSLMFGIPSYLLLAVATTTPVALLAIVVGCVTGMTFPAMQSLMTLQVDEDAQGELQGAIASTISLTSIVGPIIMTQIFGHFTDNSGVVFPGAPYIMSTVLIIVAITILWRTLARHA